MNCRPTAFTLLELIFAAGIAGLVMLACGVVMRMGVNDQQQVSAEISREREVGRLFEQLRQDLTTAHPKGWLSGADSGDCLAGWYVLRPLSAQVPAEAIGDVCAVGYALREVELDQNEADEGGRNLVRIQRDSARVHRAQRDGQERSLWHVEPGAELWLEGVLVFELWPVMKVAPDEWQRWHPELRAMPEAVEVRLVFVGAESREYQTLIYLGVDAD